MTTLPKTNHDAWHAVRDGKARGMTTGEIAEATGISPRMVMNYGHMRQPPSRVRRLNHHRKGIIYRCIKCDCPLVNPGRAKCQTCDVEQRRAKCNEALDALLIWAAEHERVPTVDEAARITGYKRSRAGAIVKDTFGSDSRRGSERKGWRRPWPA